MSSSKPAQSRKARSEKTGGHALGIVPKSETKRSKKRRTRHRQFYHEAVSLANEFQIEMGKHPGSTIDVMEALLRRTHALWFFVASKVDGLDPAAKPGTENSPWGRKVDQWGNVEVTPSKFVLMEAALREELFDQAARMTQLNLDTRRVTIEEKQMEILGQALLAAARAAGLTEEQQRTLGSQLRKELSAVEGSATDITEELTDLPEPKYVTTEEAEAA